MPHQNPLSLEDIDYPLPEDLIAVRPTPSRTESRLLHLIRENNSFQDQKFTDILEMIHPGDLLVMNNSRVFQARLLGTRNTRPTEMLLVERIDSKQWKAMVRQSRKFKHGDLFECEGLTITVLDKIEEGMRVVRFEKEMSIEDINAIGHTPVPPYIRKRRRDLGMNEEEREDAARYQSVIARFDGSVAAPTASLHFSEDLLETLEKNGVKKTTVTLHIGPGTFKPIESDIENFKIHREWIEVREETVQAVREAKDRGGRVIAVGTTVVRSLETAVSDGKLRPYQGYSELFVRPGFDFHVIDAMLTNFHMPKSTLLLLVYAFAGRDLIRRAYAHAIKERYRFFSYGDAMFIE